MVGGTAMRSACGTMTKRNVTPLGQREGAGAFPLAARDGGDAAVPDVGEVGRGMQRERDHRRGPRSRADAETASRRRTRGRAASAAACLEELDVADAQPAHDADRDMRSSMNSVPTLPPPTIASSESSSVHCVAAKHVDEVAGVEVADHAPRASGMRPRLEGRACEDPAEQPAEDENASTR